MSGYYIPSLTSSSTFSTLRYIFSSPHAAFRGMAALKKVHDAAPPGGVKT
jgi:hypothetical protein